MPLAPFLRAVALEPRTTSNRWSLALAVFAALASIGLLFWAFDSVVLAAAFASGLLAVAAVAFFVDRRSRGLAQGAAAPLVDWTLMRETAEFADAALVVTDRNGRALCANSAYGVLFPTLPTPPTLGDAETTERLAAAARRAWRDGRAVLADLCVDDLALAVDIVRGGERGDHLLWALRTVEAPNNDAVHALLEPLGAAGVLAVVSRPDGRIAATNSLFAERALGDAGITPVGEALEPLLRIDARGRLHLAREFGKAAPPRIVEVPLDGGDVLLLMLDGDSEPRADAIGADSAQQMIAMLPFGLAMVDRDGRFLFINSAFARAAGIEAGERPVYPGDIVIAEDKGAVADAVRRYATAQQYRGDIAIRLRHQPDEPVALSLAGVRGIGDAAVLLSLKDNSEEVRLRRQVTQATKMQAVGQLAGGVAHDFNNILTAIIGYCDLMLMRHTPGDSDYADIVQIQSNSNRAAALTRQLLAFSRQQTLRPQILQLPDVISEVSSLLSRSMGDHVTMRVNHGRGLGPVRADPNQLEQVLLNLAVNARDAMPDGGELVIETYPVLASAVAKLGIEILPAADYSVIKVSDTGIGIPPEVLPKIFEPFFTTKDIGKGTGLGLSTVYGVIKQSEGWIFAESVTAKTAAPGQPTGTSFTIYLPVYHGSEPVGSKAAPVPPPAPRGNWGSGSILLVEDEEMVRAVAERALARVGYKVTSAANGVDALRALAGMEEIDLLVSDVVMPQMDGPTLVTKARELHPDLPVLFMSGYAEEQLRQMIPLDRVAFLPKPFSVAQLTERVQATLADAARG